MVVLIGSGHVTYGLGAERQTAPHYEGRNRVGDSAGNHRDDDDQPVDDRTGELCQFPVGITANTGAYGVPVARASR